MKKRQIIILLLSVVLLFSSCSINKQPSESTFQSTDLSCSETSIIEETSDISTVISNETLETTETTEIPQESEYDWVKELNLISPSVYSLYSSDNLNQPDNYAEKYITLLSQNTAYILSGFYYYDSYDNPQMLYLCEAVNLLGRFSIQTLRVDDDILSASVSSDGSLLFFTKNDSSLKSWEPYQNEISEIYTFKSDPEEISDLDTVYIDPDGYHLIFGDSYNEFLYCYDLISQEQIRFKLPEKFVLSSIFSTDIGPRINLYNKYSWENYFCFFFFDTKNFTDIQKEDESFFPSHSSYIEAYYHDYCFLTNYHQSNVLHIIKTEEMISDCTPNFVFIPYYDEMNHLFCLNLDSGFSKELFFLRKDLNYYRGSCIVLENSEYLIYFGFSDHGSYEIILLDTSEPFSDEKKFDCTTYYNQSIESLCHELDKEIENNYGIELFWGKEGNDFDLFDYVGKTNCINTANYVNMLELKETLSLYPTGFIEDLCEFKNGFQIYFASSLYCVSGFGIESAAALTADVNGKIVIVLNIDSYIYQNFSHEMMHAVEMRINELDIDGTILENWKNTMPSRAIKYYAYSYVDTIRYGHCIYNSDQEVWFIDDYSKTYPKEDRARIMEYLMLCVKDPSFDFYFEYPVIQAKAEYLCQIIRQCFPSCQKEEILIWETTLKQ